MKLHGILAIGKSGQVGLNGELPWHDAEDLAFFKKQTMGAVISKLQSLINLNQKG